VRKEIKERRGEYFEFLVSNKKKIWSSGGYGKPGDQLPTQQQALLIGRVYVYVPSHKLQSSQAPTSIIPQQS
jgi:hypothetical protein